MSPTAATGTSTSAKSAGVERGRPFLGTGLFRRNPLRRWAECGFHLRPVRPDPVPNGPESRPAGSGEQPESRARGGDIRPYQVREGAEREVSEVKLKKGEPVDRALRRLKKKVDRENTLRDVRMKRTYEKPSEKKRRKLKVSRFSAMLAARYADQ